MTQYEIPEYSVVGWHNGNAAQTAEYVAKLRAKREAKKGVLLYNGAIAPPNRKKITDRRSDPQ